MTAIIKSSTFKSGNSVAIRLPKSLGVGPDEGVEIERRGDMLQIKIVSEAEQKRAKFAQFVERMSALGSGGGDPADGRFEFPDRNGLI